MASIIVVNQLWAEGALSINIICDAFYTLLIISLRITQLIIYKPFRGNYPLRLYIGINKIKVVIGALEVCHFGKGSLIQYSSHILLYLWYSIMDT